MRTLIQHFGTLTLRSWGGGVSAQLTDIVSGRSVFWQGDEAAAIVDGLEEAEDCFEYIERVWSDHEHIASTD